MIRGYINEAGRLRPVDGLPSSLAAVVWIDLIHPTNEEESELEKLLGIDIPTREEMEEIEISSRLYTENDASFMTATLPARADGDDPEIGPVTFVLAHDRLITVRYHEPRAFKTFPLRAAKASLGCNNGEGVLIALLEAIVDRLADILERSGHDIDKISREVFRNDSSRGKKKNFQTILEQIGRKGDFVSNIRDTLVSLERLIGFMGQLTTQHNSNKDIRTRVKTLARDTHSLTDHAGFLSQKITFLLDATLGLINIEQNAIIKIFSVAAVVFLPPTLIASIYGMNFDHMPELKFGLGYPLALVMMVASAVLPYLYFKRRGWL